MRRFVVVVALSPAAARAGDRLDLDPIPELAALKAVYPLDRDNKQQHPGDVVGSIAVGEGKRGDDASAVAVGDLAIGKHTEQWIGSWAAAFQATDHSVVRASHHAFLEYRTLSQYDDRSSSLVLETHSEHGEARGLAPAWKGAGRRDIADARAEGMLQLGREKDDFIWVAELEGAGGVTRWLDQPDLDHALRRSIAMGFGRAPVDGEIPRGTIDVFHGRVEQVNITRNVGAALGTPVRRDTEVRTVELGLGPRELTFHVDHEILAVITADLGWTWLEADALRDNMFRMKLATALEWLDRDESRGETERSVKRGPTGRRRLGAAIAREPGTTADGQRIVSDWRVEAVAGADTPHYIVSAAGGVSWLSAIAGRAPTDSTIMRYGTHLEGFAKLAHGVELGGYLALAYEPHIAWASEAAWTTETGLLVRLRR